MFGRYGVCVSGDGRSVKTDELYRVILMLRKRMFSMYKVSENRLFGPRFSALFQVTVTKV